MFVVKVFREGNGVILCRLVLRMYFSPRPMILLSLLFLKFSLVLRLFREFGHFESYLGLLGAIYYDAANF